MSRGSSRGRVTVALVFDCGFGVISSSVTMTDAASTTPCATRGEENKDRRNEALTVPAIFICYGDINISRFIETIICGINSEKNDRETKWFTHIFFCSNSTRIFWVLFVRSITGPIEIDNRKSEVPCQSVERITVPLEGQQNSFGVCVVIQSECFEFRFRFSNRSPTFLRFSVEQEQVLDFQHWKWKKIYSPRNLFIVELSGSTWRLILPENTIVEFHRLRESLKCQSGLDRGSNLKVLYEITRSSIILFMLAFPELALRIRFLARNEYESGVPRNHRTNICWLFLWDAPAAAAA